eukprot:CAMPEP_0181108394 /NCGR_PEP_ID=MMETSP1071-20121207/17607_1 /TAXON_ID=35127 /ORGANISM="Thalassiosira sp., Strain NH16" /LENGTH=313 /DNA_ID=CAMNT_0023191995 /DNA_START=63 /DNA_END=1004 /DNA_ORIENTATION=-
MKRPQTTTDGGAAATQHFAACAVVVEDDEDNDVESLRRAYKRAKKAYKRDGSNSELKRAKSDARRALEAAEAKAAAPTGNEADDKEELACSESKSKDGGDDLKIIKSASLPEKESNNTDDADASIVKSLEEAYQTALSKFKANKSDKDLRRAKTAARRALDDAIMASSTGGKQLVCSSCSKKFLFSAEEQQIYDSKGWKELPGRCEPCRLKRAARLVDVRKRVDSKERNMCYAFQRGECPHGANCKFSHNPRCGGKRSNGGDDGDDDDDGKQPKQAKKEEEMDDEDALEAKNRSKERKERSLRQKGKKGWRNK